MAKNPDHRYQTMAEFIQDIGVLESGVGNLLAKPVSDVEENNAPAIITKTKHSKRKSRAFIAATVFLGGLGLTWGLTNFHFPTKEQIIVAGLALDGANVTSYLDRKETQEGPKVSCWELIQDNPHLYTFQTWAWWHTTN